MATSEEALCQQVQSEHYTKIKGTKVFRRKTSGLRCEKKSCCLVKCYMLNLWKITRQKV